MPVKQYDDRWMAWIEAAIAAGAPVELREIPGIVERENALLDEMRSLIDKVARRRVERAALASRRKELEKVLSRNFKHKYPLSKHAKASRDEAVGRAFRALELRESGKTWKEVGEALGVGKQRAFQIAERGARIRKWHAEHPEAL